MASLDLVEKITNYLADGKNQQAIDTLHEESLRLKRSGKMTASRRLQKIIKKIPTHRGSFTGASSNNGTKYINLSTQRENSLIERYSPEITPDEVVLNSSAKRRIKNLFIEWEDFEKLSKHNLYPTNRILLYGPPGTGKTLLANAIAQHLDFPLILVRLDELISSFLGETGKNIRDIFENASREPVVLLLDEIDTIAKFRSDEKELGELKRIVTVLLQHIDFFPNQSIIIGATNHDDILDKAIWRRFPLKIKLDLPDIESRRLLFRLYLKTKDKNTDLNLISLITEGLSGSEIFDIVQNAKKESILSQKGKINSATLAKSFLTIVNSDRLKNKKLSKDNLYKLCKELKDGGLKLREIESISGVAYTTLRDNIK